MITLLFQNQVYPNKTCYKLTGCIRIAKEQGQYSLCTSTCP